MSQHRVRVQSDDMAVDDLKDAQALFIEQLLQQKSTFSARCQKHSNFDMSIAKLNEQVHVIREELTGDDGTSLGSQSTSTRSAS